MKFKINQYRIYEALHAQESVVRENADSQALTHCVIRATDKAVTISASNFETWMTQTFCTEIAETGAVAVPAAPLRKILRELISENTDIEFSADESFRATVRCGKRRYTILGADPSSFVGAPEMPEVKKFIFGNGDEELWMFGKVLFAAADEDYQMLRGVHFYAKDNKLACEACDRYVWAEAAIVRPANCPEFDCIVPKEAVKTLLLQGFLQTEISISAGAISFAAVDEIFTSRLVEGSYPAISKIVPATFKSEVTLNRKELIQAIKRVSAVFGKSAVQQVRFTVKGEELSLESRGGDYGNAEECLPTVKATGEVSVIFNVKLFRELLEKLQGENVLLLLNGIEDGRGAMSLVLPEDEQEDADYATTRYGIMPMLDLRSKA
jgi:DNA polymerase-3 subunit beta